MAGIPRAWAALKDSAVKLITGSWFELEDAPPGAVTPRFILLARTRKGYGQLCQLITTGRRQAEKGQYRLFFRDIETHSLDDCVCLWLPPSPTVADADQALACGEWLQRLFEPNLWIAAARTLESGEEQQLARARWLADHLRCPIAATGEVHMHSRERQPLQDVLTALRNHTNLENAGHCLFQNGERYLRPLPVLDRLFPEAWLRETLVIAEQCTFEPGSLRYEYPPDLVPAGTSPAAYLKQLTHDGERRRYPNGTPPERSEADTQGTKPDIRDEVRALLPHYPGYCLLCPQQRHSVPGPRVGCQLCRVLLPWHHRGQPGSRGVAVRALHLQGSWRATRY